MNFTELNRNPLLSLMISIIRFPRNVLKYLKTDTYSAHANFFMLYLFTIYNSQKFYVKQKKVNVTQNNPINILKIYSKTKKQKEYSEIFT